DKKLKMLQKINEEISEIGKLSQIEVGITIERGNTEKEIREKIERLIGSQKVIYKARKLENNLAQSKR
ncbi:20301_t:CDS:1, partial [Gigaspora margarita]